MSSKASVYAYTIQTWGKRFPVLLKTPSPKGHVELIEIIGKGNYGNVYRVRPQKTARNMLQLF